MRRTKAKAAETRNALLDAAEAVFHRQGVSGSSLAEIASAANVTRGAIYWHFADKSALFKAMTERVAAPEEEFFLERAAREGTGETLTDLKILMIEMVRRFVADERAQRVHEILLFRCEYVGEMGGAMLARRDKEDAFEKAILAALGRALARGELGEGWSPELGCVALRCVVLGSIADWLRLDRNFRLVEVVTTLLDGLFISLAGARVASSCEHR